MRGKVRQPMFPRTTRLIRWLSALATVAVMVSSALAAEKSVAVEAMGLLQAQCLSCHNAEKKKGGLDMSTREHLMAGAEGKAVVEMGKAESRLLKVLAAEADPHMPPKKQLSTNQIEVFAKWIAAGVPWDEAALAKASAPREVKVGELPKSYRPSMAVGLSPDGNKLVFARGTQIVLHDLAATNFPQVAVVTAHKDAVKALAWSADGKTIASGGYKEAILWDAEKLTKEASLGGNFVGHVTALRFTRHGGALVVADSAPAVSGWLRVMRLPEGEQKEAKEIASWRAHEDAIYDLALSSDGGFLASAGGDKMVRLWELISQKQVGQIEAHSDAVLGVALNTNATQVLTVSGDKELKLWDVDTGLSAVTI